MFSIETPKERLKKVLAIIEAEGLRTVGCEQDREALKSKLHAAQVAGIIDELYQLQLEGDLQESLADLIDAPINDKRETLLHLVCCSGDHEMVKKLVTLGADVSILNLYNANCAHAAIMFGDVASLKELMKSPGFNVNCGCFVTLVEMAIVAKSLDCLQALIDGGANVNVSSSMGGVFSPLRRALYHSNDNDIDIIMPLLSAGADIDEGVREEVERMGDEVFQGLLGSVSFRLR